MDVRELGPLTLAYLGDALMSVKVREYLIMLGYTKPQDLQIRSIHYVSAKAQANFVSHLLQINWFDEEELMIYKRGRNAKSLTIPKHTDVMTYRMSTGLEALWGYLYLKKRGDRIESLWKVIEEMGEQ